MRPVRVDKMAVFKGIKKEWENLEFEIDIDETDNEVLAFKGGFSCDHFDDSVGVVAFIFDDEIAVEFVFDKITPSLESYTLINQFNKKSSYYIGYIDEDGYFATSYSARFFDEEDAIDEFRAAMNLITSDRTLQTLKPITDLTEG